MADYSLFSQPQGPTVPISIFGEAATAGTNVGKAIGTPFSNIVQGGIKGIQQGIEIQQGFQQNEIRQNQINNLPIANQQAEATLEATKLSNKINQLNLEKGQALKEETIQNTRDKYEEEKLKVDELRRINNLKKEYQTIKESGNGNDYTNAFLSGKFSELYAKDLPRFQMDYQTSIRPFLSDQQQKQMDLVFRHGAANNYGDNLNTKAAFEYNQMLPRLTNNQYLNDLGRRQPGYTKDQLIAGTRILPEGSYDLDGNNMALPDTNGKPQVTTPGKQAKGQMALYFQDPNNPDKIQWMGIVDNKDQQIKDIQLAQSHISNMNGGEANSAARNSWQQPQNQPQKKALADLMQAKPKSQQVGYSGSFTDVERAKAPISFEATPIPETKKLDPIVTLTTDYLGVNVGTATKILPQVSKLVSTINDSVKSDPNVPLASRTDNATEIGNLRRSISRQISDEQFNSNPTLKTQYNNEAVRQYKALQQISNIPDPSNITPYGSNYDRDYNRANSLFKSEVNVTTPEDLYYVKLMKPVLDAKLRGLTEKLIADAQQRQNTLGKTAIVQQNAASRFNQALNTPTPR